MAQNLQIRVFVVRTILSILFLLSLAAHAASAAKFCSPKIGAGLPASKFIEYFGQICNFVQQASDVFEKEMNTGGEFEVLSGGALSQSKAEGLNVIMVVGRSADFAKGSSGNFEDGPDAQRVLDSEIEIISFLKRFESVREKTVFYSGASDSGDIGLFHRIAVQRGFRVIGVSDVKVTGYKPALMNGFYVELSPEGFGSETETVIRNSTAVVMLGGGNQAAREAILADLYNIPTFVVNNALFNETRMKSSAVAEAFLDSKHSKSFQSAAEAADEMTKNIRNSVLSKLPLGSSDFTIKDLREKYASKFLLGFSTWATTGDMPAKGIAEFKATIRKLLSNLDPSKVALVTAGTIYGGEGIVAEIGVELGFDVIGTPVIQEKSKVEDFNQNIKKWIITGQEWETRDVFFTSSIDGIVVAGKSATLARHLTSTFKAQKPIFNHKHFPKSLEVFVDNLKANSNIDINDVDRIIAEIEAKKGHSLRLLPSKMCTRYYKTKI